MDPYAFPAVHAAPKSVSPPVFDKTALVARIAGDPDLLRVIIGGFVDSMPGQLAALAPHLAASLQKVACGDEKQRNRTEL